jgi:hypothetical protein
MRAAEYGVQGDETAELTVFFFGAGQGGDIDQNIARWYGQLSQADGSDTGQHAKRRELKVNGIDVTRVEASGRYAGGMAMPGAPPPIPIEDATLLGAIARGPQGSVFFKLIGTRAGVERARAAFDALITSLHPL